MNTFHFSREFGIIPILERHFEDFLNDVKFKNLGFVFYL